MMSRLSLARLRHEDGVVSEGVIRSQSPFVLKRLPDGPFAVRSSERWANEAVRYSIRGGTAVIWRASSGCPYAEEDPRVSLGRPLDPWVSLGRPLDPRAGWRLEAIPAICQPHSAVSDINRSMASRRSVSR